MWHSGNAFDLLGRLRTHSTRRSRTARHPRFDALEPRLVLSTYYVSPAGNDGNPGTQQSPWLTLQHASDSVVAGDAVDVEAGTYAGFAMGWNVPQSGTASAPITWNASSGVVIDTPNKYTADGIDLEGSSYIIINGFTVDNTSGLITRAGIRSVTNTNVTVENNTAEQCGEWGIFSGFSNNFTIENNIAAQSQSQHGIYVSNTCSNPVIIGNTVWGNNDCGIQLNGDKSQGGSGIITGALIEDNIIYNNGAAGGSAINCDGVQNSEIVNNLLYNNHSSGVSLYRIDGGGASTNNIVVNNTIVNASDSRWDINIANASTGNTLYNNILRL
jgi:parallel beta-helix repeat protein